MSHLRPGPGNGCTYTSSRPDSFETYANQRASGENRGARSSKGVIKKGVGAFWGTTAQISRSPLGFRSWKASPAPGPQDIGNCGFAPESAGSVPGRRLVGGFGQVAAGIVAAAMKS